MKSNISKGRRKRINRAEKIFKIEVNKTSLEEYWKFFESSYENRNRVIKYSKEKFIRLLNAVIEHESCEIRTVYGENNIVVAEDILLKDKHRMYHQFGTQLKVDYSDAKSYAVYDGINSCLESGRTFDFEGSMIPGVCEFNSSWNPEFELTYRITKYSKKYIFLDSVRKIIRLFN